MPMTTPPVAVLETINGSVQVSGVAGESHLGLLAERGELFCGVLLEPAQARELANQLLARAGFSQSADR